MHSPRVILTYQDYLELPDDGKRYEIHEGELSVTPAPSPDHQDALGNLNEVVRQHVRSRSLGKVYFAPIDCIIDDTTIVQPDLVFVDNTRLGQITRKGVEGPPTLAVEVLSPSTARIDRVRKLQLYARYRVPYYWIVDPETRAIEAYRLANDRYELAARAEGSEPAALPPFPDLPIVAGLLWS